MNSVEDENVLIDVSKFNQKIKHQRKLNCFSMAFRSFFSLLLIAVTGLYIFSPLSKVKIDDLIGNYDLTKEDIMLKAKLNNKSLLSVNATEIIEVLNSYSDIASSKVEWTPTHINVYVDEITAIARIEDDFLLTNGITLSSYQTQYADFKTNTTRHMPLFKEYEVAKKDDAKLLLNHLKYMDKSLFEQVDYLDITSIFKGENRANYFGIYFNVHDEMLRVRFMKSLIDDVVKNKDKLLTVIQLLEEDQRKTNEERIFRKTENDIYDTIYTCNEQGVCKVTISNQ